MKKILLIQGILLISMAISAQSEWTVCTPPETVDYAAVYMPESNKALIGGTGGTLLMTEDLGNSFQVIALENNLDIGYIQFIDSQTGFLLQENDLLKTTDGGFTWNFVAVVPGDVRKMFFVNSTTAFSACDGGEAFKTTDGGLTWDLMVTGTNERLLAVSFLNADQGYFGGKNGVNLYTTNQGQSFTPDVIPANGDIMDIQFVNSSSVYTCGEGGEILFSANGGNTWTSQLTPDDNVDLSAIHFTDVSNGWSVGIGGAIFHTENGGASWVSDISNTPRDLEGLHLFNSTQGIAVGTNGTILRYGDIATGLDDINHSVATSLQVFPNPVVTSFRIEFESYSGEDYLVISDLLGREKYRTMITGSEIQFDTEQLGLSQGIYFFTKISRKGMDTRRVMVK